MSARSVLVVDDDAAVAEVLVALVEQGGLRARAVSSGEEALLELEARSYDLVLSDVRMPGLDGMGLLAQVSARFPEVPVVLLTAHATVPLAVEAMRSGAADFVLKPFDRASILFSVRRALELADAREGRSAGRPAPLPARAEGSLLAGSSKALDEALRLLDKAARTGATVVLRGESGTGKELFARELHQRSPRASAPFVAVHCAALPEALLESELFGYEKGAFTGASVRKPGRVELAEGGTLFLDEIGEVTPAVQVKLLRLLQDRSFERLGGSQTLRAEVRLVFATHRDLEAMVAAGSFREDLYYRVNVVPIWLPPLRERQGDVALLAARFCAELCARHGRPQLALAQGALDRLVAHSWPGNVRELQNLVERLVVLGEGDSISAADVERELRHRPPRLEPQAPTGGPGAEHLDDRRREAERAAIGEALARAAGNRTLAARLLGVSRRTLYNKLDELGLS